MSILLSYNFLSYLFWMTLAQHRSNSLAHIIRGVLDKTLLLGTWGIRKQPSAFLPLPWSESSSVPTFVPGPLFFGFTCTSPFAHTCPHRASGINLAELKIINPVVEEGVPLTCAEAYLLTPSFRCIFQVWGLPRRFIFITTVPCFSFTCVCQGASGESSSQVTYKINVLEVQQFIIIKPLNWICLHNTPFMTIKYCIIWNEGVNLPGPDSTESYNRVITLACLMPQKFCPSLRISETFTGGL